MPKNSARFDGADGCVYVFDLDAGRWYKVCPVDRPPVDVREQVYAYIAQADIAKHNADIIKDAV